MGSGILKSGRGEDEGEDGARGEGGDRIIVLDRLIIRGLHVHEMIVAVIEIHLRQPDTNWEDRISLDATAATPETREGDAFLVDRVGARCWDGTAQSDEASEGCRERKNGLHPC